MTGEELQVIRLRNDFYRDGFQQVLLILGIIITAIGLLIAASVYLFLTKPAPVVFKTYSEFRVLAPAPLNQPYLTTPDLMQWVSRVVPTVFTYDFIHYKAQLQAHKIYFTDNGWKKFLDLANGYASYKAITNSKLFMNVTPAGAPFIVNQGLLGDQYGWWIQMPIDIQYVNYEKKYTQPLVLQILVQRTPTLNNLYGVSIENIVIKEDNKALGMRGPE